MISGLNSAAITALLVGALPVLLAHGVNMYWLRLKPRIVWGCTVATLLTYPPYLYFAISRMQP